MWNSRVTKSSHFGISKAGCLTNFFAIFDDFSNFRSTFGKLHNEKSSNVAKNSAKQPALLLSASNGPNCEYFCDTRISHQTPQIGQTDSWLCRLVKKVSAIFFLKNLVKTHMGEIGKINFPTKIYFNERENLTRVNISWKSIFQVVIFRNISEKYTKMSIVDVCMMFF